KKSNISTVIKFLHLESNTPKQIKASHTSLADDECLGRPTIMTITDNIEKVHQMRWMPRLLTVNQKRIRMNISKALALSHTSMVAMIKINEFWFELTTHVFTKSGPQDFFLFPQSLCIDLKGDYVEK
ncbi:hypothetical protein ALC53_10043, partial [Atta colombica]